MVIKNVLIRDAEEKIEEIESDKFEIEKLYDVFEVEICECDCKIFAYKNYIYIDTLSINVHSADYCSYDQVEQEYLRDHSSYVFFDSNTRKIVSMGYEGDLISSICSFSNFTMEYVRNELLCDIYIYK